MSDRPRWHLYPWCRGQFAKHIRTVSPPLLPTTHPALGFFSWPWPGCLQDCGTTLARGTQWVHVMMVVVVVVRRREYHAPPPLHPERAAAGVWNRAEQSPYRHGVSGRYDVGRLGLQKYKRLGLQPRLPENMDTESNTQTMQRSDSQPSVQKMSIARGLKELKTLDKRVRDAITKNSHRVVTACIKGRQTHEIDTGICSRVEALKERRRQIKAAITASNATHEIEIGTGSNLKRWLVAEAIERQRATKEYDALYIKELRRQLAEAQRLVESEEEARDRRLDSHLQSLCGRDSTRTRADDVEAITEVFLKNNPVELVDPLKIGEKIAALETELEDFEENVDVALSEHNAITCIEIPASAQG